MSGAVLLVAGLLCVVLAGGFVALMVWLAVTARRRAEQRQQGMAAYAHAREWTFHPHGPGLEQRFAGDPFGRGHRRTVTNVVDGRHEGRPFLAFDYAYDVSSGDENTHHEVSVVALHLGCPVPTLQVSPQGSLGRFFGSLFGTDLVIGVQPFDDRFHVRTDAVDFARDVLHPDMTAMLSAYQDRAWRMQGDSLLMFRRGQHSPAEVDHVLASMQAILARVPPHVWARLQGGR